MSKEYRINRDIKEDSVRLIMQDGTMKGIMPLREALFIAEDLDLDLVELSPPNKGELSICKIMDYGKMMYHNSKRERGNKHVCHTKEIKYSLNISPHDLETKHRKIVEFLSKHYVVKYTMELKGRQKGMIKEALSQINSNLGTFVDMATWKDPFVSEGNKRAEISTVLHPK